MASTNANGQYYAVIAEVSGAPPPVVCESFAAQGSNLPGTNDQPFWYVLFGLYAGTAEVFVSRFVIAVNPYTGHALSDVQVAAQFSF